MSEIPTSQDFRHVVVQIPNPSRFWKFQIAYTICVVQKNDSYLYKKSSQCLDFELWFSETKTVQIHTRHLGVQFFGQILFSDIRIFEIYCISGFLTLNVIEEKFVLSNYPIMCVQCALRSCFVAAMFTDVRLRLLVNRLVVGDLWTNSIKCFYTRV